MTFGPLERDSLERKLAQEDLEGAIYRKALTLGRDHRDEIDASLKVFF